MDNIKRVSLLKQKIKAKGAVKIIEAHNGLSGIIADRCQITLKNGRILEFDGIWESSLTDSASKGLPDIEIVSYDSRLATINQILEVTNKPMIVDGDTGGDFNQFEYLVKRLEKSGVSMVIIEDKIFPKRNSLEAGTKQELEDPAIFAEKIRRGLKAKNNPDFMIVGRIESLIAGHNLEEALRRAKIYLEAGADGIMIHAKDSSPKEILAFAKNFHAFPKKLIRDKILVSVPTTYNATKDQALISAGFNIIIHANHLLRAAYKAMENIGKKILFYDRSFEADSDCSLIQEIFSAVGFLDVKKKDQETAEKFGSQIRVIIPAAGSDPLSRKHKKPKSLLLLGGKTILERQIETLKCAGLNKFILIRGFMKECFKQENIQYIDNPDYQKKHILHSLFCARSQMNGPFIFLCSDIIFNENNIRDLLKAALSDPEKDIIIMVDNTYQQYKNQTGKNLDLVTTKNKIADPMRQVLRIIEEKVDQIGHQKMKKQIADYEFIGIAYFSERGAKIIKDVYDDAKKKYGKTSFQEATNIHRADLTDLLQEIVDRGYRVHILKIWKGWMEIDNEADYKLVKKIYANTAPQTSKTAAF